MSTASSLGHLRKRIHVPRGRLDRAAQLDQAITGALSGLVEAALEQEGIRPDEQVCVDRVALALNVTEHESAEHVGVGFARAFARAVRNSLDRADDGVVRYRTPAAAITDLVERVARDDLRRAWAWVSLGLWPAVTPSSRAARADLVLLALARAGLPAGAVLHASPRAAWALVRAASESARLQLAGVFVDGLVGQLIAPAPVGAEAAALPRRFERSLSRAATRLADEPPAATSVRALLALITTEATWLTLPVTVRLAAAARVAQLHRESAARTAAAAEPAPASDASLRTQALAPGRLLATSARQAPQLVGAPSPVQSAGDATRALEPESSPAEAVEGHLTSHGGLLFLLHLVDALRWPERFGAALEVVLHSVAVTLLPVEPDDAAALAFAGKRPGDEAPEPPEATLELAPLRAELLAALRARLVRAGVEASPSDGALLELVCHRRAVITADPGWFDVEFELQQVSPALRRAGLDLDPGWLPWLGVVVRFRYA